MNNFNLNGRNIKIDKNGLVSLTDLWKASGKDKNVGPSPWKRLAVTKEYIKTLTLEMEVARDNKNKNEVADLTASPLKKSIISSKHGGLGSMCEKHTSEVPVPIVLFELHGNQTYAVWAVFLEYAAYLSAELRLEINKVYMRYKANDRTMALKIYEQSSDSNQGIMDTRISGIAVKKEFDRIIHAQGLSDYDIRFYADKIYIVLFGSGVDELTSLMEVPRKGNLNDYLEESELKEIDDVFRIVGQKIEHGSIKDRQRCAQLCNTEAVAVVQLRNQQSLPYVDVIPHIREGLKTYKPNFG